jgi:exopolysaccharide production protein ExoQ
VSPGTSKAETPDVRQVNSEGVAFAVGFYFSFRLGIVLFSVRILGLEPSTGTGLSLALDLLLLGLVCFNLLGSAHHPFPSMLRLSTIRWVFVFLALSCCSLAWSETASLPNSAAYWLGLATDVAIMILLLRGVSAIRVSHSLMKGFIWSTCCLALVAWIMPAQSDLRLGDEQFFNTNEIGNICAFTIFLVQYLIYRKDGKWRLVTFFLVVTLLRSLSKTTLVAFLLGEAFMLFQDRSMSRKTKVLLVTSALLLVLVFGGLFEAYYDIYTSAGNQAETLTGRTAIWLYVLNAVFDHPWNLWIGHGFDSWWKVVPPFGDQFEARHAENELLQQFYAYGVLGVITLVGLYGSFYRQVRRLPRSRVRVLFLGLLLFIVVRGLAEADSFDLLFSLWSIVLISLLADRKDIASQVFAPAPPHAKFGLLSQSQRVLSSSVKYVH